MTFGYLLPCIVSWPRPPHPSSTRQSPVMKRPSDLSPNVRPSGRHSPQKDPTSLVRPILPFLATDTSMPPCCLEMNFICVVVSFCSGECKDAGCSRYVADGCRFLFGYAASRTGFSIFELDPGTRWPFTASAGRCPCWFAQLVSPYHANHGLTRNESFPPSPFLRLH